MQLGFLRSHHTILIFLYYCSLHLVQYGAHAFSVGVTRSKSVALPFKSFLISYQLQCVLLEFLSLPLSLLIYDSIQKESVWLHAGAAVLLSL